MARGLPLTEHLLRRGGFGASADDLRALDALAPAGVSEYLLNFERQPDDVDAKIGQSSFASITAGQGAFTPATNIDHARQRWLFRMVHTQRPLQEKMALFWHNHFATAYSKVAGTFGSLQGTKMMALKEGELPGPQGQLETLRQYALGNFRDLLVSMAKDPAMLVWLDGRTNVRARPQENFGREVMELFTFGLGNYTEQDVYAAARVFTGWNLRLVGRADDPAGYYEFFYNAAQHDATAKDFTFAIYPDGTRTIPARSADQGMQDGLDFIAALARHPQTARRIARKLWNYFISEVAEPDPEFVESAATIYLRADTGIRPLVQYIFRSQWFLNPANWYTHYSWPAEFVAKSIKELGWNGFSVDTARGPLTNMGQTLFEPPDVAGWDLGQGWFSTGSMLARMNFASTLALNQKFNLARDAAVARSSPDKLLAFVLDRLSPAPYDTAPYNELSAFLTTGAWTGSDAQLQTKASGLARLIIGSSEYQFV